MIELQRGIGQDNNGGFDRITERDLTGLQRGTRQDYRGGTTQDDRGGFDRTTEGD